MVNFENEFKQIADDCLQHKKFGDFILRCGKSVQSKNLQYNTNENGEVYDFKPYILTLNDGVQVFLDTRGREVLHEAPYDVVHFKES